MDTGNYLCALITLDEALVEYEAYDGRLSEIRRIVRTLINECDMSPLYNRQRNLFFVGDGETADNFYDLYESEMRTTDIVSVALGYAPPSHIAALGKPVLRRAGKTGIASWGGTAFEYFMPLLFLPAPKGTLSYDAVRFAKRAQVQKRAKMGNDYVFGTSESCYYAFDPDMNYQYKAHGVQELALDNGVDNELVISPYSSFLMASGDGLFENNLQNLKKNGAYGKYGFYEAVDFTPCRVGGGYAIIKCYMAHHIGMSVLAAANLMLDGIFVKRFTNNKRIAAHLPLLYEALGADEAIYKRPQIPQRVYKPAPTPPSPPLASAISNTVCLAVCEEGRVELFRRETCLAKSGALLINSGGIKIFLTSPPHLQIITQFINAE